MNTNPDSTDAPILAHSIGGQRDEGRPEAKAPVYNPADGTISAQVLMASAADIDRAVDVATDAFGAWSATTPLLRARVMFRFRQLCESHRDELARILTLEHGKTLTDAMGEITRGIEVVEFACGIPHLLKGEHTPNVGRGVDSWAQMHPLGVVAGITPFNFPVMVPMWMYPIALACGNCFILKPSEKNPSASILIADLLAEAGLPPGVFNVVNGGRTAVDTLLTHEQVQAISFVGSTPVAKHIFETGSRSGKRVQALGGAKNHLVVMPDASLDSVVSALMGAAYGSAGERCMAISVAVCVGDATADALVAQLAPRIKALKIGNGLDEGIEMGPLITKSHQQKVISFVENGVEQGAELVVDGRQFSGGNEQGFFLGGCLFDKVAPTMRIYREEIFGPVLCVVRVPDLQAAIDLVNAHPFANGTAIFTKDGQAAREYGQRVGVGMIGVNVPIPVPMAFHSFGGWKQSLYGPLAIHGIDGVRFYTQRKTITARWVDGHPQGSAFSMPVMK